MQFNPTIKSTSSLRSKAKSTMTVKLHNTISRLRLQLKYHVSYILPFQGKLAYLPFAGSPSPSVMSSGPARSGFRGTAASLTGHQSPSIPRLGTGDVSKKPACRVTFSSTHRLCVHGGRLLRFEMKMVFFFHPRRVYFFLDTPTVRPRLPVASFPVHLRFGLRMVFVYG